MHKIIRLDKYLANIGVCSRRNVEAFLKNKIVSLNGQRVNEPGIRINLDRDRIRIDGKEIKQPQLVYFLLNKPKGYVSTTGDSHAKKIVTDLIKTTERIYPVGRLDKDTTGLLILTNDGELTNKLTHPSYHIDKTYKLTIQGNVKEQQIKSLQNGVKLEDGMTSPSDIKLVEQTNNKTILEMTIHEGRNRQIRRMCKAVSINLLELERIAIGNLKDNTLPIGKFRELTKNEIETLYKFS